MGSRIPDGEGPREVWQALMYYKVTYLDLKTGSSETVEQFTVEEAAAFMGDLVNNNVGGITHGHGFIERPWGDMITGKELYYLVEKHTGKIKHRGDHTLRGHRNVLCQACVMGMDYEEGEENR